jgi:prepilin-type N-terminal cleavage/methylation domain-containing protein
MRKGFTLIELLIVIAIIGILAAIVAGSGGRNIAKIVGIPSEYSSGERTGVLNKISKKGFFWKTWEGELNIGGMSSDAGGIVVPNVWSFSIDNDAIAQQLLVVTGKRCTLKYKELYKTSYSQGETDYLIQEVVVLE